MKDEHGSGRISWERSVSNRKRRNWGGLVVPGIFIAAVIVATIALFTDPRLRIRSVVVEGAVAVDPATIVAEARVPVGSNILFALLTQHISRRVAADPNLSSVVTIPLFPHTVEIRVVERQPYAVLAAAGQKWMLDDTGVPFRAVTAAPNGLPIVAYTGAMLPGQPVLGKTMAAEWLPQAYKLITLLRNDNNLAVQKITVDQSGNLCLNSQDNLQIKLGQPDSLPRKIQIAQATLSADNGAIARQAAYIDLSCPDQPVWLPRSYDRDGKNEDGTISGLASP